MRPQVRRIAVSLRVHDRGEHSLERMRMVISTSSDFGRKRWRCSRITDSRRWTLNHMLVVCPKNTRLSRVPCSPSLFARVVFATLLGYAGLEKPLLRRVHELQCCRRKHVRIFFPESFLSHPTIFIINFNADTVPSCLQRRHHGRCGATERVDNGISMEREHPYQSIRYLQREWCRVLFRRCATRVPELLEPLAVFFL